eukprot:TRINITY_DN3672_c0_g1_i3.p1 TRINITY_DN3672_c0_g1~~TRINITY_DN3672_c0_g1_i3.p1  ORF type:complete len:653 (-),score=41.71 TRINITY_DN3672_c0_g1_i3:355-2187(-)
MTNTMFLILHAFVGMTYLQLNTIEGATRQILQSEGDEETYRLATRQCDPTVEDCQTAPVGVNTEIVGDQLCVDVKPQGASLECSEYAALDLCDSLASETFCAISCGRCCPDRQVPGLKECPEVATEAFCNTALVMDNNYCQKSCNRCPGTDEDPPTSAPQPQAQAQPEQEPEPPVSAPQVQGQAEPELEPEPQSPRSQPSPSPPPSPSPASPLLPPPTPSPDVVSPPPPLANVSAPVSLNNTRSNQKNTSVPVQQEGAKPPGSGSASSRQQGTPAPPSECGSVSSIECDTEGLSAMYFSIIVGQEALSSWSGSDPCVYQYILCSDVGNGNQRVTGIDLRDDTIQNSLVGVPLVSELSKLRYLETFYFPNQPFVATVPAEYSVLTNMKAFEVYGTLTFGPLPKFVTTWQSLESFALSFNTMTGTLPTDYSALTNLRYLYLGDNIITSSLPVEYSTLINLKYFDVHSNILTGDLPEAYSIWNNMETFVVYDNQFQGSLPRSYSAMSAMGDFEVSSNYIRGPLPEEYSVWKDLYTFFVWNNDLTGTLHPQYSTLTNLQRFHVSECQFTGTLPVEYSTMRSMQSLIMDGNLISGSVPSQWSSMTVLEEFDNAGL